MSELKLRPTKNLATKFMTQDTSAFLSRVSSVGRALASSLRTIFRALRCGLLCRTRSSKNAAHRIVRFMAGVFVNRLVALGHRDDRGPRASPHRGIING